MDRNGQHFQKHTHTHTQREREYLNERFVPTTAMRVYCVVVLVVIIVVLSDHV